MHFRKPGNASPLCWEGWNHAGDAFMTNSNINKVSCEECRAMYYYTGKELEVTTASLDLWLDGRSMDESAGWRQPINIDFDRFLSDAAYAEILSDHITRSLEYLANELEEIGISLPNECARE